MGVPSVRATRTRSAAFAGAALLAALTLGGCATSGASSGTTVGTASASSSGAGASSPAASTTPSLAPGTSTAATTMATTSSPAPNTTTVESAAPLTEPPAATTESAVSSSSADEDWATLQAALAQADAELATAQSQGWWSGPICSPDIEMHRENAGQEPLPDEQVRAECAANITEFWASKVDYEQLMALDNDARITELARVGAVLGLPSAQPPTIAQVVVVHGCEQGWITDPAVCSVIPAG